MQRITSFFKDLSREMKKVSWPKKKELTSYTITVISTVIFFVVFFVVVDFGISAILKLISE